MLGKPELLQISTVLTKDMGNNYPFNPRMARTPIAYVSACRWHMSIMQKTTLLAHIFSSKLILHLLIHSLALIAFQFSLHRLSILRAFYS